MNYRKMGLLFASILLLILSILVPRLEFLIWFAFVPYFLTLEAEKPLGSLLGGIVLGAVFFSALLYWIMRYELRIFVIVILLTLPFFGLFGFLTNWFWRNFQNRGIRILAPALSWSTVSFLYSLTPLEIIGDQIAFLQAPAFPFIVRITGISGIPFLIFLTNSLIAQWLLTKQKLFRVGIFAMFFILGLATLRMVPFFKTKPIEVVLVQHNFPIPTDWRFVHRTDVLTTYEKVIRELGETANLIIFPQYGLPIDILREPEWLEGLARLRNTSILLGTYIPKLPGGSLTEGERFDTALLFSPKEKAQEYRAVTPPPFRKIGQVVGTERKPLLLNEAKVGVMLCYEDIRPEEGRLWVKNGAEILVALSNPGHFLGTPLPRYHLLHDRIRAIETGRYIIRVSANGFSAIINPNGKIVTQSKLNQKQVLRGMVYPITQTTPFVKIGPFIYPLSALVCLILVAGNYGRNSIKRLARKIR